LIVMVNDPAAVAEVRARTVGAARSEDAELFARIAAFLDAHHVMSLATVGTAGPHAANLFYARDHLSLVWLSDAGTRHSQDVEANPQVAATVAPDYSDFPRIRGVQIEGAARRVANGGERARLFGLLAARYPFLAQLAALPPAVRAACDNAEIYRLEPERIVLVDNTRGFAHKEMLDIAPQMVRASSF
jgi:uncharacterized protein